MIGNPVDLYWMEASCGPGEQELLSRILILSAIRNERSFCRGGLPTCGQSPPTVDGLDVDTNGPSIMN